MVVGHGLMAQAFSKYAEDDSLIIFASGVSNSLETKESEFARERKLLFSCLNDFSKKRFIYFGTCSIYDHSLNNTPYIAHKKNLEKLIRSTHKNYLIIRLPNIAGKGGNENTLINYLVNAVKNNLPIKVWVNSSRNILSQEDVGFIVQKILDGNFVNQVINVANPNSYLVIDILNTIEDYLNKEAIKQNIIKGETYSIDINDTRKIILSLKKDYSIRYLKRILEKYY